MKKKYLIILVCLFFVIAIFYFFRLKSLSSKTHAPSFTPIVSPTYKMDVFVKLYGSPRDLTFSPQGTLLASIPSQGRIVALLDKNNDKKAEKVQNVITGLENPHGIAFFHNKLFIAESNYVSRYTFDEKNATATFDKILFQIPNHGGHTSRSIVFDKNGKLFVSIGSSCNVCKEQHAQLATITVSDEDGSSPQIYAKGLRNAAFLAIHPLTNDLWVSEMGRDYLGDTTPPDEINIVKQGNNYGWPYCYGDNIHDDVFDPGKTVSCEKDTKPLYKIPAHSAPLGLAFIESSQFPASWQHDLLIAYHGSWNKTTPTGYKIVHLTVKNNTITKSEDFLTGFIPEDATAGSQATGRPVDLIFDKKGTLYFSDDKSNSVYIVSKK